MCFSFPSIRTSAQFRSKIPKLKRFQRVPQGNNLDVAWIVIIDKQFNLYFIGGILL